MATLDRASVSGVPTAELASRAWAGTEGWASSTASKPAWTCWLPAGPSVRSCQPGAFNESGSMEVTRVWVMSWPALSSGSAQAPPRDCMPGLATQCASRWGRPAAATRPAASSTCTELALQRLQMPGTVSMARAKRGSRTVKYWAPASKLPKGVSMVAVRPPAWEDFSNTVTRCPACTRVRAQAIPAMPAQMMAKWRWGLPENGVGAAGAGTGGVASAVLRRSRLAGRGSGLLMGGLSVTVGKRDAIQNQQEPLYTRYHPVGT